MRQRALVYEFAELGPVAAAREEGRDECVEPVGAPDRGSAALETDPEGLERGSSGQEAREVSF
jgi:hypothetical protein